MSNVSARTPLSLSYLLAALGAVICAFFVMGAPGTSLAVNVAAPAGGEATASPTATYVPGALAWTEVVTPNMQGLSSELSDIEALSANDIWAVGSYSIGTYTETRGLLLHWDGKGWSRLPDPGTTGYRLGPVSVSGPDDVWTIAAYVDYSVYPSVLDYQLLHWDGQDWSTIPTDSITGTISLANVEAIAPDDVWVVGSKSIEQGTGTDTYNLMLHWDGSAWTEYKIAGLGLRGISALAPDDIWAVGYAFIHWDGSSWTVVQEYNNEGYTGFNSVAAISENDAWAVGFREFICGIGCNGVASEVAHWDGTSWNMGPYPSVSAGLEEVAATGPSDVWVVGTRRRNNDMLYQHEHGSAIYHLNGAEWDVMDHPVQANLSGVTAISPTDVWAVGASPMASDPNKSSMAILHYGKTPAFRDVPLGSTFYPYISCLSHLGFISGFPDGTFRPGDSVTRGQLAKIVANTAGLNAEVPESRQTFADVPPPPAEGSTYWLYVERLYERGVIAGYDCTPGLDGPLPCDPLNRKYYLPNAPVSRGQTSKIVANTVGYDDPLDPSTQTYSDVPPTGEGSTFWPYIERLTARGIMGGYPCSNSEGSTRPCDAQNRPWFLPGANVTRGQSAKIVANTFYPNCQAPARK